MVEIQNDQDAGTCQITSMRQLAEKYDTFLFDCDGVLWAAEDEIGSAFRTITWLESLGKQVFFVTNNSSKVPADCVNKMQRMGFEGAKVNHVYSMSKVIAKYLV